MVIKHFIKLFRLDKSVTLTELISYNLKIEEGMIFMGVHGSALGQMGLFGNLLTMVATAYGEIEGCTETLIRGHSINSRTHASMVLYRFQECQHTGCQMVVWNDCFRSCHCHRYRNDVVLDFDSHVIYLVHIDQVKTVEILLLK